MNILILTPAVATFFNTSALLARLDLDLCMGRQRMDDTLVSQNKFTLVYINPSELPDPTDTVVTWTNQELGTTDSLSDIVCTDWDAVIFTDERWQPTRMYINNA